MRVHGSLALFCFLLALTGAPALGALGVAFGVLFGSLAILALLMGQY